MRRAFDSFFFRSALLVLLVTLFSPGCSPPVYRNTVPPVLPTPTYDQIYPYYIELTAVSQIRATFAKYGGSPGHAVMFLKGVCIDEESPYPKLELCDPAKVDLTDGDVGTGISVNKLLKNANWIAVPGRQLFVYGNLKPGELLDEKRALKGIEDAVKAGVFRGLKIHEKYEPPADDLEAEIKMLARETLGTDFALTYGRAVVAVKLPLTLGQMQSLIDYLNRLNEDYSDGEVAYRWSGISDNCVHVLRNGLASADVWAPKPTNLIKLMQIFNLAVPSNEVINLAFRGNTFDLEDWWAVYSDKPMRRSLMERDWLPTRHGALLTFVPAHEPNELWDTGRSILVLDFPIFGTKRKRIKKMYKDPRYTVVTDNLRWFAGRYEGILKKRPEDWQETGGDPRMEFRKKYYEYIETQLTDVEAKLRGRAEAP
jgi:hypothetical protein